MACSEPCYDIYSTTARLYVGIFSVTGISHHLMFLWDSDVVISPEVQPDNVLSLHLCKPAVCVCGGGIILDMI